MNQTSPSSYETCSPVDSQQTNKLAGSDLHSTIVTKHDCMLGVACLCKEVREDLSEWVIPGLMLERGARPCKEGSLQRTF